MVEILSEGEIPSWIPTVGLWEQLQGRMTFVGADPSQQILNTWDRVGIAISGVRFSNGTVRASITPPDDVEGMAGQILLGFSSLDSGCISAGIGGFQRAYVIAEFVPGTGWRALRSAGSESNLKGGQTYQIEVTVEGQSVSLSIDGIRVVDHVVREPLKHEQIGLYAQGAGPVRFDSIEISRKTPTAFVVMEFGAPYDDLYSDVIEAVCAEFGLSAIRADNIYGPGNIIQDIIRGLNESQVVIADVTPPNPNVFYELGYSHAINKPTILLANSELQNLPFDIRGERVIFYDNTIGGKDSLETNLRRHLGHLIAR